VLEIQNLSGGYGKVAIAHEINLAVQSGEWLSLIGANGSGKSTLLRLISRILSPQQGIVLLDGKSIHTQPASVVAQSLAILPQQQTLPEGLTVQQMVSLGRAPHQPWYQWELSQTDRQIVQTAIAQTGVQEFCDRPVEQLSGGERQRVFLALALAQQPQVLLLDEPTTYLDIRHQLQLLELLKHLNQQITIMTVLHDMNLAARYSDRIALLHRGRLWAIGKPAEVLTPEHLAATFEVEVKVPYARWVTNLSSSALLSPCLNSGFIAVWLCFWV
jgi:iron complex transport system ATP-binding protein